MFKIDGNLRRCARTFAQPRQAQIFPAALDLLLDYTAETLSVSSSQFQARTNRMRPELGELELGAPELGGAGLE